jgi:hypothetical protein
MHFKPDWDDACEYYVAWWEGRSLGRVTLAAAAPRPADVPPPPEPPGDSQTRWTDPDFRISQAEYRFATTYFGGEAFPYFDTNVGPGSLALFLGCPVWFSPDTVWYEPIASTPQELPELKFDGENEWWLTSRRLVEQGMERGRGRYLVSQPDLIENLDIIASLLGTSGMLYGLKDDPEGTKKLLDQINDLYFSYYDDLFDNVLDGEQLGSCFSAFQIWSPGKVAKIQCDAAAMLSPEDFAEFFVPAASDQTARLTNSAYHLDGPDAVCHIDELVKIPDLNAIQWTPGIGQPTPGDETWWPMYRKVLDGGKGLLLLGTEFDDVEPLARHLGPDGVYIGTNAPSIEAADDLLRRAKTW